MDYQECKAFFKYYLSLEKDCFRTETYATFHELNFQTFSIEYAKLLLSICCEVETVLKKICFEIKPDSKCLNIAQYRECIIQNFRNFASESVLYRDMNYQNSPWQAWEYSKIPKWWKDYTEVKHKRADIDSQGQLNFFKANQENVLNALSALYISEQYLLLIWESKNNKQYNHSSYVLESLKSLNLVMFKWAECYESFMGNAWVNLTKLYSVVGYND